MGILLQAKQIKRMIGSYVGENKEFERQFLSGELDVELCPQGTLAERLRAAGAGIPAFYTPTGVGTLRAEGRETRNSTVNHIFLKLLSGDFGLVKAHRADTHETSSFGRQRETLPIGREGAKITIAEVEELVPAGALDPDEIHLPGIYVQHVLRAITTTNGLSSGLSALRKGL